VIVGEAGMERGVLVCLKDLIRIILDYFNNYFSGEMGKVIRCKHSI
jgi:hypothetical protein